MLKIRLKKPYLRKITLLFNGECGIDEAVNQALSLKGAKDEFLREYSQRIECEVGAGGYGFDGRDLRIPFDGIYSLGTYYVVNLKAKEEEIDFKDGVLKFISLVQRRPSIVLYSDRRLKKELRDSIELEIKKIK